ncbi:MAG: hypothetical protein JWP78_3479 [Mucilaginibacter sp.]|nr:hypothetical protein [Mucilaginibacter sp.]
MNWKLIFQLSVFGLIMAFATVFLIPEMIEPCFWLAIFLFCAYVIAQRVAGRYFLHGFFVSLVNGIWITAAHIVFYSTYIAHHPNVTKMAEQHPFLPGHPRLAMLIMGPVLAAAFGLILGLFSFIASLIVKRRVAVQ